MPEYIRDLDRLVKELEQRELDAMLIAPSPDLYYMTGFFPMLCERFQGLFITKKMEVFYICNLLTADEAREKLPGIRVYSWFDGEGFLNTVRKAFEEHDLLGKRIGVNSGVRAVNLLEIAENIRVSFVSARDLCPELRIIKNEYEIQAMRRAGEIAQEALARTVKEIKSGMSERDVKQILVGYMERFGGNQASAMVASGPNGSFPHYNSDERILREGDPILIDFGCSVEGLSTDISRTFFLGKPTPRQTEIYSLVYEAVLAAEKAFLSGERWIPELDKAARDVISKGGYGEYFTTRLGHGMGYLSHEAPDIKRNNRRLLEPGMCFTIEPGIYIAGEIGVRIEDCLALTPSGKAEILTDLFPKESINLLEQTDYIMEERRKTVENTVL